MSRIRVSDLNSAGSEFFQDSETFLLDLKDDELCMQHGGIFITTNISVINVPISEDIFAQSISFIR